MRRRRREAAAQEAAKFWSRLWLRLPAPGSAAFFGLLASAGPASYTSGSGPKLEAKRGGETLGGGGGGSGGRAQRACRAASARRLPGRRGEPEGRGRSPSPNRALRGLRDRRPRTAGTGDPAGPGRGPEASGVPSAVPARAREPWRPSGMGDAEAGCGAQPLLWGTPRPRRAAPSGREPHPLLPERARC